MEPHIMPLHSSSPPPLNDDDDGGELGSDEDEFGHFGRLSVVASCSPLESADSTEPPSSLRQPSTPTKPATQQPNVSFNLTRGQSQPRSSVHSGPKSGQMDVKGQDSSHLTNGYAEKSGTRYGASTVGASSPREEAGFADFTVFTGQSAHPWCCGFSPIGSTEQWHSRVAATDLAEQICDTQRDVIMDSEPRSHCVQNAKENVCTKVKHCERRDAALRESSQDHLQPQEAAADLGFRLMEPHLGQEDEGSPGHSWPDGGHSLVCSSLQMSAAPEDAESEEDREESLSNVPQTFNMCESASASLCDDLSFEGVSADLEPNVSSLSSQEDQTDWDQTDDEDEELGNYKHSDSLISNRRASLSQSEAEKGFHRCNQSATQETPITSSSCRAQPHSVTYTEDKYTDFNHRRFEPQRDQEPAQTADVRVRSLGSLPPSDSFADFCSAPTQEDGDGSWAEFKDQRAQEHAGTCTPFREQVGNLNTDEDAEEERYGVSTRISCQASLLSRVQQLLHACFPPPAVPAVDSEDELLGLDALLCTQRLDEPEEEKPELSGAPWMQPGLWWPHQDVHSAVGLQFQWGGSHTNRTLLRCLGVDTRNIVFFGLKKQPLAVPAFASGLGMLEPTKDSVLAVRSPEHAAVTAQTPPGPQDNQDPSTDSLQEALPSSQLGWSSHGLSSSQDDCSALNLDCFGPEEESRSSSSSSGSSPPPGVDRDLYELTISKLETSAYSCNLEDTLHPLMSTTVRTSTSIWRPQQDGEMSAEAGRVIEGLSNLSFMRAKVLMFPSILVPKACSAE